ncbi:MAG: FAD-binding protein [Bacilli bacterium]|nr:FAD-binding protein [Bacilli bacterium]
MSKKILVLTKIYKGDLNTFDESAYEAALRFPDAEVLFLAMAPSSASGSMKRLSRLGGSPILISDILYAGSDTIATATILSKAIEKIQPDLIFAGRNSFDGDTGQIPYMLAQTLGFEMVPKVIRIQGDLVETRDERQLMLSSKQLVTFEKVFPLRSPSIFSKEKPLEIWNNEVLGLSKETIGQAGSPTRVVSTSKNTSSRRNVKFVDKRNLVSIIEEAMKEQKAIDACPKKKAPRIHYVGNLKEVANLYAFEAVEVPYEGKTIEEIENALIEEKATIVLFEEKQKTKELACRLAIKYRIGLTADCVDFKYEDGQFHMIRPALGGDIEADIVSSSPIAMATVKAKVESDSLAFSVGKGAVDNLETIVKLAEKMNAAVVCSRPLADKGILPYESQVGLTGKIIAPKVVVAFGVSGAIQHIVGIAGAKTIIGVNSDKKAPIFDFCDYGIEMDINELKIETKEEMKC